MAILYATTMVCGGYSDINIETFHGTDFSYGEENKEAGTISLTATKKRGNL